MKSFYQLVEAIKIQSRGLSKPLENAQITDILQDLPRKEIVKFALYCAIDCRKIDDSSESVKACYETAQDCINKVKLWLKNNNVDCSEAARAAYNAAIAAGNLADDVAFNAAINDDDFDNVYYAAHDIASFVAWAAYWAAYTTYGNTDAASNAASNAACAAGNKAAHDAKIAEYTQMAQHMRENIITFDLPNEAMQLAKVFAKTGDIEKEEFGLFIDLLIDYDNYLIEEKDGKFKFVLMPSITGDSHQEVYEKIANNPMAREQIVQTLSQ